MLRISETREDLVSLILSGSESKCLLNSAQRRSLLEPALCSAFCTSTLCMQVGKKQEERGFPYTHSSGSFSLFAPHPSCLGIFRHHLLQLSYRDNVYLNFCTCLPFCLLAVSSLWFRLSFHHFPSSGTSLIRMT